MRKPRKKEFDCIEYQHQVGEQMMKETVGMSIDEQVAYWKRRTDQLRRYQAEVRRKRGIER